MPLRSNVNILNLFWTSLKRLVLFCASSDENRQPNAPAMLAYAGVFDCIFEEHRDNDRTKFWSMSYERE